LCVEGSIPSPDKIGVAQLAEQQVEIVGSNPTIHQMANVA